MSEATGEFQERIKPPTTPETTKPIKTDALSNLQSSMTILHAEAIKQGTTKEALSLENANKATLILDGSLTLSDLRASGFGTIAAELSPLNRNNPGTAGSLSGGLKTVIKASRTPQLLVAVDISNRHSSLEDTEVEGDYKLTEARFFDEYPSATNYPEPVITISDFEGEGRKRTKINRKGAFDIDEPERINSLSEELDRFTKWATANKKGKVFFKQTAPKPIDTASQ